MHPNEGLAAICGRHGHGHPLGGVGREGHREAREQRAPAGVGRVVLRQVIWEQRARTIELWSEVLAAADLLEVAASVPGDSDFGSDGMAICGISDSSA